MPFRTNIIKEASQASYDFVLQEHIKDMGKQLTKLPHEIWDTNTNKPSNTTHKDIVVSYADMVDHLEAMLAPYQIECADERPPNDKPEEEIFRYAQKKSGYLLCEASRLGLLLQKIEARATIEEDEEDYAKRAEKSNPAIEVSDEQ